MKVGNPLELREDGGGPRHFLEGRPVHCGDVLELQEVECQVDRETGDERYVPIDRWLTVGFEADLHASPPLVYFHLNVGGYLAKLYYEPGMRLRWPIRGRR